MNYFESTLRIFLVWIALNTHPSAFALPDFVRFGYPNCSSCHVSPAGGSILTDYGRSFSSERLSTFSRSSEERFGHGALPALPDWLILGGNFRNIQTFVETPAKRRGRWINMQRDVDICTKNSDSYLCLTGGIITPASFSNDKMSQFGLRKLSLRHDVNESISLRLGRFYPRYGLMLPNHTTPVRSGLGFESMAETDQMEFLFTNEFLELGGSYEFKERLRLNSTDRGAEQIPALNLTIAIAASEAARIGTSARRVFGNSELRSTGAFVSAALSEKFYVMAEIDRAFVGAGPESYQSKTLSYGKLGFEPFRGLVHYIQFESNHSSQSVDHQQSQSLGTGIQFFPRPHFEFDIFGGQLRSDQYHEPVNFAHLLVHYYL